MENKEIRLNVRIGAKDLFSFMAYHTYYHLSGLFGIGLSLLALVTLLAGLGGDDPVKNIILLVLGLLFTVINPLMLFAKAKQQAMNNPMYKENLCYTLTEEGISLSLKDTTESIEWAQILKFKKTKRVCILYTTQVHAILLPFACMEGNKDKVVAFIESKVRG